MAFGIQKFGRLCSDLAVPIVAIGAGIGIVHFGMMPVLEALAFLPEMKLSAVRRGLILIVTVTAYWLAVRYHQQRNVSELTVRPVSILISSLIGAALITLTIAAGLLLGFYDIHSYRGFDSALPVIGYLLVAASIEEILFRGILFRVVEAHSSTVFALALQSLAFGGLHLFNDATTGMTVVSVTLLGALWALIYVYSRNLWVVIANHLSWNLMIFFSGLPLSGVERFRAAAPFDTSYEGTVWISGGQFGPEDSILNIGIVAAAVIGLVAWCLQTKKMRLRSVT